MAGKVVGEPVWTDGKATGNRATREAIGLRVERDGGFYFCLQSSPEDTPELTGALEADMTRAQVEGMLQAIRVPLERRWPFAEEPATHALEADSVHYELRAPWGVVHEHDLPDKQVFITVHDRKDQEWLTRTLEEALRVMDKHPRQARPKIVAAPAELLPIAEARAKPSEPDSPKLESDSPKPESDSPKPESDSPKPESDSPKPESDSPKPEPDSPKPVPDSAEPESDSPEAESDSASTAEAKDT